MAYQIEYASSAVRSIGKLPRALQRRLLDRIEGLADNPRPPGSLKLTGQEAFRMRVGDYRVVYTIIDAQLVVLVVDVGHRREVYRRKR